VNCSGGESGRGAAHASKVESLIYAGFNTGERDAEPPVDEDRQCRIGQESNHATRTVMTDAGRQAAIPNNRWMNRFWPSASLSFSDSVHCFVTRDRV